MRPVALAAIGLVLLVTAGEGQRAPSPAALVQGTLSFDGRATAGDFSGTTSTVTGQMTGGPTLTEVRGWVEAAAGTLVTGNARRDRDLNKSMETAKYPTMRFNLTAVREAGGPADSVAVVLEGDLMVHGVTLRREIEATVAFAGDSTRVRGSFPLDLRDHKIGGLSKFLGVLRMYPDITVHLDLTFVITSSLGRGPAATR